MPDVSGVSMSQTFSASVALTSQAPESDWNQDGWGRAPGAPRPVLTAVVADVAQSSARLQKNLLVCGAEQLNERRDEAGLHAGAPHELWGENRRVRVSNWNKTWCSSAGRTQNRGKIQSYRFWPPRR